MDLIYSRFSFEKNMSNPEVEKNSAWSAAGSISPSISRGKKFCCNPSSQTLLLMAQGHVFSYFGLFLFFLSYFSVSSSLFVFLFLSLSLAIWKSQDWLRRNKWQFHNSISNAKIGEHLSKVVGSCLSESCLFSCFARCPTRRSGKPPATHASDASHCDSPG